MPQLPPKKSPMPAKPTPGKPKTPNVAKAVKAIVYELVPEATLAETGMAMILAQLAQDRGMDVAHVVEFPDRMREVGLPDKLPHRVIRLAHLLNRNAIDAMLWRTNRSIREKPPERTWEDVRKLTAGEAIPQTPKAVAMVATPQEPEFDIFG